MKANYFDHVFDLTENEKKYLNDPAYSSPVYEKLPQVSIAGKKVYKFQLPNLSKNIIEIRRDSRFTSVPSHIHSNLCINYIYSGCCNYTVNNEKVHLTKGDICIVDRNVVRSKERLNSDDIIFNISLSNDFFSRGFIMGLGEASILTNFLFSAITQNNQHDGYLIFKNQDLIIDNYLNQLIQEYFNQDSFSRYSIEALFSLIFIQLIRNYQMDSNKQIVHMSNDIPINLLNILDYIEKNCETCTLEKTAKLYNYHPKYFSQLIKSTFGKSFKDIQTEQRLENAAQYLDSTTQPISEISNKIGMSNVTLFYKKFKTKYGMSPSNYRNRNGSI